MPSATCAVCGQGGYWVGFDGPAGEFRCLNHLSKPEAESDAE